MGSVTEEPAKKTPLTREQVIARLQPLKDEEKAALMGVQRWQKPAELNNLLQQAKGTVKDAASYKAMAEVVRQLKAHKRAALEFYKPIKRAIDTIKNFVLGYEDADTEPIDAAIAAAERAALDWQKAEKAREDAEKKRLEREALEKAEAEKLAKALELREAAKAEPDKDMKRALQQEAKTVASSTAIPQKVDAPRFVPAVRGFAPVTRYSGELVNLMELVKAVAAGDAPLSLLKIDQTELNRLAVAQKDAFQVPGCKVVKDTSSQTR